MTNPTTTTDEYAVTIDIPAGISSGQTFGSDAGAALHHYTEAKNGSYPKGTKVVLWKNDEVVYETFGGLLSNTAATRPASFAPCGHAIYADGSGPDCGCRR